MSCAITKYNMLMKFLFKRESSAVDWQRQWERDRARSRVFQKFMRQKKANSMQGLSAGCPWGFCLSCGNGKDGQNWEGVTLSRGRSVWCFVHDCGVQVSLPGTLTLKLRKVEWKLASGDEFSCVVDSFVLGDMMWAAWMSYFPGY
jgi:hypothetical protein